MRFPVVSASRRSFTIALVSFAITATHARAGDLATAKSLYAEASYEEALKQLASLEGTDDPNQIEQVRALCFLALGRTSDAERSLEAIVVRSPLYRFDEEQVSPRLVGLFRDVRKRTLADAARDRYAKAKSAYDGKDYKAASAQFKEILAIAGDPDAAGQAETLADLKQLAEGFLTLSNAALAAAPPPLPAAAPATAPAVAVRPAAPQVYSSEDADVVGPVEIRKQLPRWRPPSAQLVKATLKGLLEIVIDEQGNVESASLPRPVWATYDAELLKAARMWQFRPATRNGIPVKYRKMLEIILNPPSWDEEG
jgi:TonB family protein